MTAPLIYRYLHQKLVERDSQLMHSKRVIEVVRRTIRLPKSRSLDYKILRELEKFELIKKVNKKKGYVIKDERAFFYDPF